MPEYEDAYNEALHRARQAYRGPDGLAARTVRSVYDEFAALLIRIREAAETDDVLTTGRADVLRRQIRQHLAVLSVRLESTLIRGVRSAADLAVNGHSNGLRAASEAAGVTVEHNFDAVPTRALENMFVRRGIEIEGDFPGRRGRGGLSGTFETLFRRRIRFASSEIDDAITRAVAQGKSAGRFTRELAATMARDDPALAGALQARGSSASALHRGVAQIEDAQFRRLLYDARRIAVSEPNNAFHEADVQASIESPVVDMVKYSLSGRHAGLHSSPDACDVAANADVGFGPGLYPPAQCPSLMHPHCACSTTKQLLRPSQWDDPPERSIQRPDVPDEDAIEELLNGHANEFSRKVTRAHVKTQRRMFERKVMAAYGVAQEPVTA